MNFNKKNEICFKTSCKKSCKKNYTIMNGTPSRGQWFSSVAQVTLMSLEYKFDFVIIMSIIIIIIERNEFNKKQKFYYKQDFSCFYDCLHKSYI